MEYIFLSLFDFFRKRRLVFYLVLSGLTAFFIYGALKIKIEEDITKFFPKDEKVEKLNRIFQDSKFLEKMVVMVSWKDSSQEAQPDSLIAYADELVEKIQSRLKPYVKEVRYRVDDAAVLEMFNTIVEHLPVFLDEADYPAIDSLIQPDVVKKALENNYRQLISPAGMVLKRMIVKDPVGISTLVMKKLQALQYDENYELYDNYIVTRDHRHIVFFILPEFPPNETGNNGKFIEGLDDLIAGSDLRYRNVAATYFGAVAVAVGNARQLREDTIFTVSVMVVILVMFFIWFFRRKSVPLLILIPVVFGGLFSLACIYFIQGSVSVLAIAAGSMILGIAVNYSLHFFVHLKHTKNVRQVIAELAHPMTIGSATTVLAFFCLQFVNAAVLRDVGLFAGFSLIGAALCSLIFLPHLIRDSSMRGKQTEENTWIDRISLYQPEYNRYLVLGILLLTPVLFYFAGDVKFNSDMNRLNYMSDDLRKAEQSLNAINEFSLRSVYIVAGGKDLQEALRNNEKISREIEYLKQTGTIRKVSSVSSFIVSDSLQAERIRKWNIYWTPAKKASLVKTLHEEGGKLKFTKAAFSNFDSLINHSYKLASTTDLESIRKNFFDDYISEKAGSATIVTLTMVDPSARSVLHEKFKKHKNIHAVDRQLLANMFVGFVNADFNFIVTFTSILVFIALLISFGRIELALTTFIPMIITWIWILGIMALLGIEFNIVNVMISTFIFGLGDDYSIFIMDGLQQEYKFGRKALPSIKTSIFLSAFTTIAGLGVLIFAQHPALKSIAAIAIVGIACVFVMSQTIEPFLFSFFISKRAGKGLAPMTFWGICKTIFAFFYFIAGSFVLTTIGFVLIKLIPVARRKMRLMYHTLLSAFTRSLVYVMASVKKKLIGKGSFDRPSVIVCNHQSFLDILVTTMLHPRIILLTNKWVWNSPVFGGVVRLADYYPVIDGAEQSVAKLKERTDEGYSIVVFPEGTRSPDGRIKRFHKGAFFLAEQLHLPIQPLLLHGTGDTIQKKDFYLNDATMTLKFLPAIQPDDKRFGMTYSERTKLISSYFRKEYKDLDLEARTPDSCRHKVISNYIFKGPVLEWYMRVKLSLEKNYKSFEALVPKKASILDLGCGYGFLCYMLYFLSDDRDITGVDYDEDKTEAANRCYAKSERIRFVQADVTQYNIDSIYDVIILSDVLHYLSHEQQNDLLEKSFHAVAPGGTVIIREGNKDIEVRHKGTQLTEFFSVKLLRFNKSVQKLNFMSGETIRQVATRFQMKVDILDDTKFTSNVIFVVRKPITP